VRPIRRDSPDSDRASPRETSATTFRLTQERQVRQVPAPGNCFVREFYGEVFVASSSSAAVFARRVFSAAGVVGLLMLVPQYFLEKRVGIDNPPAITHPEFFYGFVGVAVAWQVAFLIIGRDPIRFRPLMLAAMLEKATFVIAVGWLFAAGRTSAIVAGCAGLDLIWGLLFAVAYARTHRVRN
jgi:hypothetical protein